MFSSTKENGIIFIRYISNHRDVERGLYGVNDLEVYDFGLEISNFSPDQYGRGNSYSLGQGTKVSGLPVYLGSSLEGEFKNIRSGSFRKAKEFIGIKGQREGALLVARFDWEQISSMELFKNLPFQSQVRGLNEVKLETVVAGDEICLKLGQDKAHVSRDLLSSFDSEGYLKDNRGEYFVKNLPPVDTYRDSLYIFRPDREGNEWNTSYRASEIPSRESGLNKK